MPAFYAALLAHTNDAVHHGNVLADSQIEGSVVPRNWPIGAIHLPSYQLVYEMQGLLRSGLMPLSIALQVDNCQCRLQHTTEQPAAKHDCKWAGTVWRPTG